MASRRACNTPCHGWSPVEIERFIDQHLNNGVSLPALSDLQVTNRQASATVSSKLAIKRADLFYTTDTGPLLDRCWQSATATVDGNSITVSIPADASIWMLTATDSRDAMVSTRVQFAR